MKAGYLKAVSVYDLQAMIAERTASRRRIGWFDRSNGSYDMQQAMARAVRVFFRVQRGARLTLRDCQGF